MGGALVISLDFELHWGVRDSRTLDSYRANLLGVRQAIPAMLELFAARGIHATWATVGILFCRNKKELEDTLPTVLENSTIQIFLIGPGDTFIQHFSRRYPRFRERFNTSGRLNALEAGSYLQTCDVLLQIYPDGACAARGTLVAALASGVPVVTMAGPLTEPLLKHGGVLALADPNPISIRVVLEELLADPALAGRIGAAGRHLYETEFDVPVAVRKLRQTAGIPA